MANTKLYIPVENLEVESEIKLGNITIHPSSHAKSIIDSFNKITKKTKNTEEQKKKFIEWNKNDLQQNLGRYAFAGLECSSDDEDKLIPKDLSPIYNKVREVLAVLYLLQKQIVGVASIEHQKFGLKRELYRSLNHIVAIQGEDRSTYGLYREGVLGDWTFVNREIYKFATNTTYTYFNSLMKQTARNEIEKRTISSIVWFYDAALDFTPISRFTKLIIALEALFASEKDYKSFRLSRFSTLLSHLYIMKNWKCLCPILESHKYEEYIQKVHELNLPGVCSAFWDMRKWYKIRSGIIHDANRVVDKKDLDSLEWWTNKLIVATIDVISKEKVSTLDEFEFFLENEYRTRKATW